MFLLMEKIRKEDFVSGFVVEANGVCRRYSNGSTPSGDVAALLPASNKSDSSDVYLSYTLKDRKFASFLSWALRQGPGELSVCDQSTSDAVDANQMNGAQCVVVLLSSEYHRSRKKVDEFNMILGLARNDRPIYVIHVDELQSAPTYMHLVDCKTCLSDAFWKVVHIAAREALGGRIFGDDVVKELSKIEKSLSELISEWEILALQKAALDIQNISNMNR